MKFISLTFILTLHIFYSTTLKASSITDLEEGVVQKIIVFCDNKSLAVIPFVCKNFKTIACNLSNDQIPDVDLSDSQDKVKDVKLFFNNTPFKFHTLVIALPVMKRTNLSLEIIDVLKSNKSLTQLNLSGNILDPAFREKLSLLTNLQALIIDKTCVFDQDDFLSFVTPITTLTKLQACQNQLHPQGLKHIAGLTKLKDLNLQHNMALDDGSAQHILSLTNLEHLNIKNTLINEEVRKKFANLRD